ncbi:MAG: phosphatidylserine decarboxylase [Phycisphaerales bacterium]
MLAALALASAVAWWLSFPAGVAALAASGVLFAWGLWFFRDPLRTPPAGPHLVLSPADGRVIKIDAAPLPVELRDAALALGVQGDLPRVSIFLNLFNVHVNRTPAAGRIVKAAYVPGKFFNASLDKASVHNERSGALLVDAHGRMIGFVQIAGLVARRIVNHLREGQQVGAGERFGLIRFGSRAEVYLPPGSTISVRVGEFVVAGESVLGHLAPVGGVPAGAALAGECAAHPVGAASGGGGVAS